MKKVIYIYSLKDPRDYQIKYVGKTIDVNRRLKEHTKPYNLKTNSLKNIFSGTESKNQDELPTLVGVLTPEAQPIGSAVGG